MWFDSARSHNALIADFRFINYQKITIMSTSKKNIERKNEQRATQEVIKDSCTLAAQLKALWHNHSKGLVYTDSKGVQTNLNVTKEGHISYMGMQPHYVGKGDKKKNVGYTPAEFNAAVAEELLVRNDEGKVKATYVYRDRVVNVELLEEGEEGKRNYSLYTKEEAEKKAKGESGAKSIKLYRKVMIDDYGWGDKLIMDVLTQSKYISEEITKAEKSLENWENIEHVYIVKNVNGLNVVVEVEKPSLEF